ncbi:MAG: type 4a pilus biogenesis protein PilO [Candidatus Omnitrophica bacterium]|nr:type 4a pilus biogenesis protein PilO [Candidatus Omnitrophota bacterium]
MDTFEGIGKYKNKILNIGVILFALFLANNIYKNQTRNIAFLTEKKTAEIQKKDILDKISQYEKRVDAYKRFINTKDVNLTMNNLIALIDDPAIKIISIKPNREQGVGIYIKYPFDLVIETNSYHALAKFINKVENHPDVYIIESADIKPVSELQDKDTIKLVAYLKITTVLLKE